MNIKSLGAVTVTPDLNYFSNILAKSKNLRTVNYIKPVHSVLTWPNNSSRRWLWRGTSSIVVAYSRTKFMQHFCSWQLETFDVKVALTHYRPSCVSLCGSIILSLVSCHGWLAFTKQISGPFNGALLWLRATDGATVCQQFRVASDNLNIPCKLPHFLQPSQE